MRVCLPVCVCVHMCMCTVNTYTELPSEPCWPAFLAAAAVPSTRQSLAVARGSHQHAKTDWGSVHPVHKQHWILTKIYQHSLHFYLRKERSIVSTQACPHKKHHQINKAELQFPDLCEVLFFPKFVVKQMKTAADTSAKWTQLSSRWQLLPLVLA